jgi:hypothetical protein
MGVTDMMAAKVRCKEARHILRKPVEVSAARLLAVIPVAQCLWVLEAQAALGEGQRQRLVPAVVVLAGTLALAVRATLHPALARLLRPVPAAAAVGVVVWLKAAAAVVVSASLV